MHTLFMLLHIYLYLLSEKSQENQFNPFKLHFFLKNRIDSSYSVADIFL